MAQRMQTVRSGPRTRIFATPIRKGGFYPRRAQVTWRTCRCQLVGLKSGNSTGFLWSRRCATPIVRRLSLFEGRYRQPPCLCRSGVGVRLADRNYRCGTRRMPQGSYERSAGFFRMRVGRPGRLSWDDKGVAGDKGNFPIKVHYCIRKSEPI